MNKILIITSCSLRHYYFAHTLLKFLNNVSIKIILEGDLQKTFLYKKINYSNNILKNHFNSRHNSEIDFFSDSHYILKNKNSYFNIKKGKLNDTKTLDYIMNYNPDLIVTYGCSIIKPNLINLFKNRIVNVHLGLSPYYKGAGTNFHALVNNEFHFMGYSFIYMDEGIDSGEIIHQSRAKFLENDNPHTLGNRLIKRMSKEMVLLISNFKLIKPIAIKQNIYNCKYFMIKDASEEKTKELYESFTINLKSYIIKKNTVEKKFPIIKQKFLKT